MSAFVIDYKFALINIIECSMSYCTCTAFIYNVITHYLFLFSLQKKYREEGRKEISTSLYSQLAETTETQHAKTVAEQLSEVRENQLLIFSHT